MTIIPQNAFYDCIKLASVNIPEATFISNYAFNRVKGWTEITSTMFPKVSKFGANVFIENSNLTSVYFPSVALISNNCFWGCIKLQTAIFPMCSSIYASAFYYCNKLTSLYLFSTSVASLTSTAFNNTPLSASSYLGGVYGSVYVRESLVDAYKAKTGWSYYSDRIVGLTDAEIAAILEG